MLALTVAFPVLAQDAMETVQPEDVSLSRGGIRTADSARNQIPGTVRRIVQTGADARVEVDCGFALMARVTRRSAEELGLAVGTDVVASFKATAAHVIGRG